jgi:ribosome recycling factor
MMRTISSTPLLMAPKSGKGKKKGGREEEDEIELPSASTMAKSMDARIVYLKEEFSKIRGGQVSADMFNHIKVTGYEVPMTLSQSGQISIRSGNTLVVNVYDPALMTYVSNSLRDCGMSLNPSIEGGAVVASIPKSSAESRAEMAKLAAKAAEKVD